MSEERIVTAGEFLRAAEENNRKAALYRMRLPYRRPDTNKLLKVGANITVTLALSIRELMTEAQFAKTCLPLNATHEPIKEAGLAIEVTRAHILAENALRAGGIVDLAPVAVVVDTDKEIAEAKAAAEKAEEARKLADKKKKEALEAEEAAEKAAEQAAKEKKEADAAKEADAKAAESKKEDSAEVKESKPASRSTRAPRK